MAIVVAVISSFIYTGSIAIQQVGNLRADRKQGPAVLRLLTTPMWVLGFLLGLVGFGLHFVALGLGTLIEVQVAQTSQIVFMLPFSAWTAKAALERHELLGTALVALGLVGSIVFGQVRDGVDQPDNGAWVISIIITAAIVVALVLAARAAHGFAAALYGTAAGIVYGVMAALMKDVTEIFSSDGLVAAFKDWQVYVLIVSGLGAVTLQQLALRAGHLSAGLSALSVGTPVMSTILGITIFEETFTTNGVEWLVYGIGVALAIAGVFVLARSPAIAAATVSAEADDVQSPLNPAGPPTRI
ncbi:MAG: DMT family transporter [Ilumatobacteraceae bacterium]